MRNQKGFTLIELLIVVAIIGIIAAIAIPNLLNAIDRGKQKRTMADIRSIGTAVESYAVDNNFYPKVNSYAAVTPFLEPIYIKTAPTADGWNKVWTFAGRHHQRCGLHRDQPGEGRRCQRGHRRDDQRLQLRHPVRERPVLPVAAGYADLVLRPLRSWGAVPGLPAPPLLFAPATGGAGKSSRGPVTARGTAFLSLSEERMARTEPRRECAFPKCLHSWPVAVRTVAPPRVAPRLLGSPAGGETQ